MKLQVWQHSILIAEIHLPHDRPARGPLTDEEQAMVELASTAYHSHGLLETGYYDVVLTDDTGYEYDSQTLVA